MIFFSPEKLFTFKKCSGSPDCVVCLGLLPMFYISLFLIRKLELIHILGLCQILKLLISDFLLALKINHYINSSVTKDNHVNIQRGVLDIGISLSYGIYQRAELRFEPRHTSIGTLTVNLCAIWSFCSEYLVVQIFRQSYSAFLSLSF